VTVHVKDTNAVRAYQALQTCGPRGRELAGVLDRRGTHIRVTPEIYGGFTLNFINTIFIMPLRPGASEIDFRYWVSLLGHEACHVEQRFWVDSVEQEINAYATQARLAQELGINLDYLKQAFSNLDPKSIEHQRRAQTALLTLFATTPAAIVYASLPLIQPQGLHAFVPAFRELAAVVQAAFHRPPH